MAHPNFLLNDRTLVIGGSSGIGFAVASAALSNRSNLQSLYPNAHVSGSDADVSNTETLEANLRSVLDGAVKDTGGPLDHIVYSAGGLQPCSVGDKITAATVSMMAASLTKELGTPEGVAEAYLFCMRSTLATGQGPDGVPILDVDDNAINSPLRILARLPSIIEYDERRID
ncbi:hypothetical protein K438DRAFT_1981822 [Mycena galopus ATCC 62051]|nr:hypothetical protein K438DRAFT_1981822 [Mycena galopus ATCC 62051]